jgi:hypothetical protein
MRRRQLKSTLVPHPQIVTIALSDLARYFAAMAAASPVRFIVISIESMIRERYPFHHRKEKWYLASRCRLRLGKARCGVNRTTSDDA